MREVSTDKRQTKESGMKKKNINSKCIWCKRQKTFRSDKKVKHTTRKRKIVNGNIIRIDMFLIAHLRGSPPASRLSRSGRGFHQRFSVCWRWMCLCRVERQTERRNYLAINGDSDQHRNGAVFWGRFNPALGCSLLYNKLIYWDYNFLFQLS